MKLIMKLVGSLSLTIWLSVVFLIISVEADQVIHPTVNDSDGEALQAGVEYYIQDIPEIGGRYTVVLRNDTCPYYVSHYLLAECKPVVFTPLEEVETVIREDRDVKIEFTKFSGCRQSSYAWLVDDKEPITERTLIATGTDTSTYPTRNYFRIQGTNVQNVYSFRWCKFPYCQFECQDVRSLIEHGQNFLALNGPYELTVKFQKAHLSSII